MRQLAVSTALVLATLAGLAIFWELRGAALIFFLSLGTSAALRPVIEQFHRWGLPRSLALAVTYLGSVLAFLGLTVALVFPLSDDLRELGRDFRTAYQDVTTNWPQGNALQQAIAKRLPSWDDLQRVSWRTGAAAAAAATSSGETVDTSADSTLPATSSAAKSTDSTTKEDQSSTAWWTVHAVHTLLGVTWGFFGTILNVLIIVVLSLYWSIDRVHFERLWLSLLDVEKRQRARETWRAIEHATGAYLQREVVQSLVAGFMLGIGFWVFGQPYPVLSAAIGALAWLIPWIGAPLAMIAVIIIWLPRFLLAGGQGLPLTLLGAAAYALIVLMLLEWFVEPRLFQRKRYNPILLVLVAVGMVDWLGLLGLLIAPPVAAAVQIVAGQFIEHRTSGAVDPKASPRLLAQRLNTLRARLDDAKDVPDETRETVDRLAALVEQARLALDPATAEVNGSTEKTSAPSAQPG